MARLPAACPDIEVVSEADKGTEAVARVADLMPDLLKNKNVLSKLHLQNRVWAVAFALCEGILPEKARSP
jgi:DNA-binding NarL/FixJ family response regulator